MLNTERRNQAGEELILPDIFRVIWRRKWYALAPLLVALVAGILVTGMVTPVYRAEITLQVNAAVIRPQDMDPFSGLFLSREAVPTFVQLANTPSILDQVAANLGVGRNVQSLGKVTASQLHGTEFFVVIVENTNPQFAVEVANEVAEVLELESEFEWQRRAATAEAIQQAQLGQLQEKIQSVRAALAAANDQQDAQMQALELGQYESRYAAAMNSLQDYQMAATRINNVLTVRSPAVMPTKPAYPRPFLMVTVALSVGVAVGLGLVYLLEQMDNKVKSPKQIARILGVPVIGALPVLPKGQESGRAFDPITIKSDPMLEPYHLLRTNLRFAWADNTPKTVMVTSAEMGEGKTTVLANLGVALAITGKRVILVDADLRRPQLHRRFGLERHHGLAELLDQDGPEPESSLKLTGLANLRLLTAGRVPEGSNPAVLLASDRMNLVLRRLREGADVVLIDTPPVLYSSDALSLMSLMDQVLLVIWSGMLRSETVHRVRDVMGMVDAKHVEVVLNRVRKETDAYAYYYNSYYYGKYRERKES